MNALRQSVRPSRRAAARLGLAVAFLTVLGLTLLPSIERFYLKRAATEAQVTLRIAVEGLRSTLDRFAPLPKLLAERPILSELLKDPENQGLLPYVNEQLRLTAQSLGVSDVYLMDIGGTTIAASSYRKELSFVGRNFSFRPYFQQAIDGGLGQFFALGTTSGERGYFLASPVLDKSRIIGVIAIKFLVDPFEVSWRGGTSEIIVTDLSDVVFMSSRPEWRFRTLSPLKPADLERIRADRQYPEDQLIPMKVETEALDDEHSLLRLGETDPEAFVVNSTLLSDVGWRVWLLTPAGAARSQALIALSLVGLLILLMGLTTTVILQRNARAREREVERRAAQEELERRVDQRTTDLNDANARLRTEIDERTATETRLRRTQKELVQAGKLAALGQMSAALSHEINQPLTAVKSYADNAAAYLDRKRISEARENVTRISQMADRMAALSGHLRNFARRPQETVGPVDLSLVLDDALGLMETGIAKASATVERAEATRECVWVTGGRLRLQQVFVNLISNALDAMETSRSPIIEIDLERPAPDRVRVLVRDRGAGLSDDVVGQVFDPFFTTKTPGKGLGLGLSISYNIIEDFGGHLSAGNRDDGGAWFAVDLSVAAAPQDEQGVAAQ
jgi:two-component system, NtrC family, C4-dicarboxylate transport sensor histidine kinase DctB